MVSTSTSSSLKVPKQGGDTVEVQGVPLLQLVRAQFPVGGHSQTATAAAAATARLRDRLILLPIDSHPLFPDGLSSIPSPANKNDLVMVAQPFVGAGSQQGRPQQKQQQQQGYLNDNEPTGVVLLQVYVSFLLCCAAAWLIYLILPRGCKKTYFRFSGRTKSAPLQQQRQQQQQQQRGTNNQQRNNPHSSIAPQALPHNDDDDDWFSFEPANSGSVAPASVQAPYKTKPRVANSATGSHSNFTGSVSLQDSILAATEARRRQDNNNSIHDEHNSSADLEDISVGHEPRSFFPLGMAHSDVDLENHETPAKRQQQHYHHRYFSHVPSPGHPSIDPLPSEAVWRECYRRLQGTGMRLTAHGVQCPSKRIWLQYSSEDATLLWQTEFPRQVPSTASRESTVWVRGAVHRIPAGNVLYIDVGKKTTALLQTSAGIAPSTCFSLLTQAGSLDLQANSKLERDAVVSALSYILDIVHQGSDWRRLYEESSTIVGGGRAPSSVAPPPSEGLFYVPSHAAISNIDSDLFPPGPNEI